MIGLVNGRIYYCILFNCDAFKNVQLFEEEVLINAKRGVKCKMTLELLVSTSATPGLRPHADLRILWPQEEQSHISYFE